LPVTSTGTFYHRPSDAYIFATVCQLFVIGRLLERALQDLSSDSLISVLFWIFVTSSSFKVGLFFGPPLPSSLQVLKEISGHCHFSPARLTVTGCSASGWLPFSLSKWSRERDIRGALRIYRSTSSSFAPSLATEEQLSPLRQQSHRRLAGCLGKAFCSCLQATKGES
jgi:hypothetical protein